MPAHGVPPSYNSFQHQRSVMGDDPAASGISPATVVLVHGLWMTGIDMTLLRWRLAGCGFTTRQFHYASIRRDLATNAAVLQRFLEGVPGPTIHFVAHSLGGLVVRRLFHDFPDQRPGRIVTLGTPHCASCVAGQLRQSRLGSLLLGRSAEALVQQLPPWPGHYDLGSMAGSMPVGAGRLFRALDGTSDGTVAVAETHVEKAADHLVLPVSHMGLVTSATVAQQTCHFLRHGRFSSGDSTPICGTPRL